MLAVMANEANLAKKRSVPRRPTAQIEYGYTQYDGTIAFGRGKEGRCE